MSCPLQLSSPKTTQVGPASLQGVSPRRQLLCMGSVTWEGSRQPLQAPFLPDTLFEQMWDGGCRAGNTPKPRKVDTVFLHLLPQDRVGTYGLYKAQNVGPFFAKADPPGVEVTPSSHPPNFFLNVNHFTPVRQEGSPLFLTFIIFPLRVLVVFIFKTQMILPETLVNWLLRIVPPLPTHHVKDSPTESSTNAHQPVVRLFSF